MSSACRVRSASGRSQADKKVRVSKLEVYNGSQLVVIQLMGYYDARDARMAKYESKFLEIMREFNYIKIEWVASNSHANALAFIAPATTVGEDKTMVVKVVLGLSVNRA
ncbi:hypothetical protein U1Q18_022650 [Sarracenia purpurea var. burkii]